MSNEMTQLVKVPDDLSSVPKVHVKSGRRELSLQSCPLTSIGTPWYMSPPHHAHLHSNILKYSGNVCMRPCVSFIAPKSETEQRTQWLNMCFCSHGDASETRYKALPSIMTLLISEHSLSCLVFLLVTLKATKEYKLWKMFSWVCGKIMRQSK